MYQTNKQMKVTPRLLANIQEQCLTLFQLPSTTKVIYQFLAGQKYIEAKINSENEN